MIRIGQVRSVAHQPADFGNCAIVIYCGDRVACRQLGQLDAAVDQERADANEYGIGPCASNRCKSRIDLAAGAGGENLDLQPHGAPSRFNVS